MESFEFMAAIQRLGAIAKMIGATPLEGLRTQLLHAETLAPIFDVEQGARGSQRLAALRRFVAAAESFKHAALDYSEAMTQLERPAALPPATEVAHG